MPGTGASSSANFVTRPGTWVANANPTMLPMSCVTSAKRSTFSLASTPIMSRACVALSNPPAGCDDSPMPRRSGTITV